MRSAAGLAGLLIVAAITGWIYKSYLSQGPQSAAMANPAQTIDVSGVKNALLGSGQAERVYQAEHGSFGALDDLVSSGALAMKKTGRDGYSYEAESSSGDFRITANCPRAAVPGCVNYAIGPAMEVQPAP